MYDNHCSTSYSTGTRDLCNILHRSSSTLCTQVLSVIYTSIKNNCIKLKVEVGMGVLKVCEQG